MNHLHDQPEDIDPILREVYERTEPPDSWQALRERIGAALSQRSEHAPSGQRQVVFWRRVALAMAACFVAAVGLLFYVVSAGRQTTSLHPTSLADAPPLLTHAQIEPLIRAFSEVRSLFAEHQPWLMIDSAGNSQIGLSPNEASANRREGIIVLRLIVREENGRTGPRYADLVAYPQQRITFAMPTGAGSTIELHLVPTLRKDGRVDIDFTAQGDHGSRTAQITSVGQKAFTPLAQIQIGVHNVSLGAVAQPVPWSGQG